MGYMVEQPDMQALAAVIALRGASEAARERGSLYPFRMNGLKTNGLLQAARWISDKYVLGAVASKSMDALEASALSASASPAYHLIRCSCLLEDWSNDPATIFEDAEAVCVHATLSREKPLLAICRRLVNASFVAHTPTSPAHPASRWSAMSLQP